MSARSPGALGTIAPPACDELDPAVAQNSSPQGPGDRRVAHLLHERKLHGSPSPKSAQGGVTRPQHAAAPASSRRPGLAPTTLAWWPWKALLPTDPGAAFATGGGWLWRHFPAFHPTVGVSFPGALTRL